MNGWITVDSRGAVDTFQAELGQRAVGAENGSSESSRASGLLNHCRSHAHQPDGQNTWAAKILYLHSAHPGSIYLAGCIRSVDFRALRCPDEVCRVRGLRDGTTTTTVSKRTIPPPVHSSASPMRLFLQVLARGRQGRTGARIEDPPALSKANCQLSTPAHMPMRLRVDAGAFACKNVRVADGLEAFRR